MNKNIKRKEIFELRIFYDEENDEFCNFCINWDKNNSLPPKAFPKTAIFECFKPFDKQNKIVNRDRLWESRMTEISEIFRWFFG